MARLGDVFELQITGEWGTECAENEAGTKVLRTTNFTSDGMIDYKNIVVRSISKSKVEKKRLRCGDIILEKSGGTEKTPVGRVVYCDKAIEDDIYLCNNFTQAMRVKREVGCSRYVFYVMWYLHYSGKTDLLQNKTTGIRNLQVKSYLDEEIPLPPLEEQHRIADLLDKVSDLIAKRRAQLDKLDLLVKARFVEMFGDTITNPYSWDKDVLGAVCDVRDGTHESPQYYDNGFPLVTSKNVTGGKIDLTDCSLICETDYNKINERSKVDIGDIIMPMIGTVGKPVIVDIEPNFAIKNVSLIKFQPNSKVLNIYILALLQSDYFDTAVLSRIRGGTQKFISLGDIRKLEMLVPPIKLQDEFATFVKLVQKSKMTIQQSLDRLEILKKALMQNFLSD